MSQFFDSILPSNPITVVATGSGIITELARLLSFGRLDAKIARAHRIDELPDAPADVTTQPLPLPVINHRRVTADVGAVAEHLSIQPLIQPFAFTAQTVITATCQFITRQKQLLERGQVDRNLQVPPRL